MCKCTESYQYIVVQDSEFELSPSHCFGQPASVASPSRNGRPTHPLSFACLLASSLASSLARSLARSLSLSISSKTRAHDSPPIEQPKRYGSNSGCVFVLHQHILSQTLQLLLGAPEARVKEVAPQALVELVPFDNLYPPVS